MKFSMFLIPFLFQNPEFICVSYLWPMKFLSLIFGIFILLLSVLPCCQEEDCCEEGSTDKLEASAESENSDLELPCSPFFSCGTCLGFTFEVESEFALTMRKELVHVENDFFNSDPPKGFNFSLTKPPADFSNLLT